MEKTRLPVLTEAILEANESSNWEPALTYPLPPDPDIDLIDYALDQVLDFLGFITSQVAQKDASHAKREIDRATARLKELVEAKPKAVAAWIENGNRRRFLKKFHSDVTH